MAKSKGAIGRASLILSATTGRLTSGLNAAYGHVRGFANRVKGTFAGNLVGASAGMAGVGLAASFTEISAKIDAAAKSARSLGVSSEYFMGLQHAADLSGVKAEKLGESLRKFRNQVDGPMDVALGNLADRIANTQDPAERARLAVQAFGESGVQLIPLFEGGSGAINDMIAEAERLGIAINATDAAKFESANDALTRVKRSVEGLYTRVLTAVAPVIESWANRFTRLVAAAKPFVDVLSRGFEVGWALADGVLGEIGTIMAGIVAEGFAWYESLFGSMDALGSVEGFVRGVFKTIATIVITTYRWGAAVAGVGATIVGSILEGLDDAKKTLAELVRALMGLGGKIGEKLFGVDFSEELAKLLESGALGKAGRGIQDWGAQQWLNLEGINAELDNVDKWMERILSKKNDLAKPGKMKLETEIGQSAGLGAALIRGTTAEASARLRADNGAMSLSRSQLEELRKINQKLREKAPPPPAPIGVREL